MTRMRVIDRDLLYTHIVICGSLAVDSAMANFAIRTSESVGSFSLTVGMNRLHKNDAYFAHLPW